VAFTVRETAQGAQFALRVQPRASRNAIAGTIAAGGLPGNQGEAVKLAITAPPVDGKANAAVIEFLAELFDVPKSSIAIVAGETGRNKLIAVRGMSADAVRKKLGV
jgi:uncharacterized protein (TIGR00251 family)